MDLWLAGRNVPGRHCTGCPKKVTDFRDREKFIYNMAGAKRNGATTFIELIRGGSTHFLKQISTGQKLFMSSR